MALRKFIACYWVLDAIDSLGHHVFPDGCSDLIFDLGSGRASFVGVMTKPFVTAPSKIAKVVGVRFEPGEAFGFLGVAAHELRDDACALGEVLGSAARSFASVLEAQSTKQAIFELDSLLTARLASMRPFDSRVRSSVELLTANPSELRVDALALFGNSRGLFSWARIAADAGYADQAHLTRELVRMTSLTPSALARSFAMSDSFKLPLGPLAIFRE